MNEIHFNRDQGTDYLYDLLEQLVLIAQACGESETATILQDIVTSRHPQYSHPPLAAVPVTGS